MARRREGDPYRREETDPGTAVGFPRSDVVADLTRSALQGMPFDRLLGEACRATSDLLDVEFVDVFELRPHREDLILREGVGWPADAIDSLTIDASEGSQLGYTVQAWEPTIVHDIRQDERFRPSALMEEMGILSGVTVVIPAPRDPWGAFGVHSIRSKDFDESDTMFVLAMGQVLSQSVSMSRIEQENERYRESNQRLERFASAVSHDLQEPLRMVSSHLQLIEDRHGNRLDEGATELLEHAVGGAQRMYRMVDSLLAYARVQSEGNPLRPVDANAILDDALTDLALGIEESGAEVVIEDLPTVEADPDQLAQVFRNLITNALEHSGDAPPRVHVDAEPDEGMWRFSVRDEGVGLPPGEAGEIFDVFRQLGETEEDDGLGIGLAICEEIVERHGGRIWVDSEPGEGSSFFFTIPPPSGTERR